ncbi:unnamed protein product [Caenorhabditis angaria]|uniref:Uncharacterized protein n=1 Tax=Caenorhabditis angaria TaxID=860376 RepID=A0A9P1IPA6_9PELO|nr:unnamed protein product [Caenorhabditis angaria]
MNEILEEQKPEVLLKKYEQLEQKLILQKKLNEYEKMLRVDYNDVVDTMSAALNEISFKFPRNQEIIDVKNEILKFEEDLDDYLQTIRYEIWKINNDSSFEEMKDIDPFPNAELMIKYENILNSQGVK